MNASRALALVDDPSFREKLEAYKKTYANNLTDAELAVFGEACRRMGLDPFARQIYVFKSSKGLQTMVSIDGLRSIAERSGKYAGQVGPFWCGPDGEWHDVWVRSEAPVACKVGVRRRDFDEIMWGVARFKSFDKGTDNWRTMPDVMLAVRAETQALRRTFPNLLGGVYTPGEMGYAEEPATNYVEAEHIIEETREEPETVDDGINAMTDTELAGASRALAGQLGINKADYAKVFATVVNDGELVHPNQITRAQRLKWYLHLCDLQDQRDKALVEAGVEDYQTEEIDLSTLDPNDLKVI